jgi:predicted CxxxxCH...CXXCH cytochrome family protein
MHRLPSIGRGAAAAALILTLVASGAAWAEPDFFTTDCSSCHVAQGATCNGCHHHKGTLGAVAGSASYTPGAPVSVTLSGGTQSGWFRALLYDQNNTEVGRVDYTTFPATLSANAPAAPGDYVWNAAWYGNNNGAGHLEVRKAVTIHVAQSPADAPDDQPPARLGTWGRIRNLFRR